LSALETFRAQLSLQARLLSSRLHADKFYHSKLWENGGNNSYSMCTRLNARTNFSWRVKTPTWQEGKVDSLPLVSIKSKKPSLSKSMKDAPQPQPPFATPTYKNKQTKVSKLKERKKTLFQR